MPSFVAGVAVVGFPTLNSSVSTVSALAPGVRALPFLLVPETDVFSSKDESVQAFPQFGWLDKFPC